MLPHCVLISTHTEAHVHMHARALTHTHSKRKNSISFSICLYLEVNSKVGCDGVHLKSQHSGGTGGYRLACTI